ncbi:sporulation protein YqfD [Siminovitchia fortis]|uniref:Sporulation protein YqfD n=1 Tax=Siminovitchia fortis TaxID=254758 RepID=A0A443J486_9BACI|nr:sporulation protein YqfD [Siminovitchia fortis]RWR15155.1 sporulation protein YqfD [Siminovitchia fortis]WHY82706.1 sporulation protein YqfD [Siminovitchia fortis]
MKNRWITFLSGRVLVRADGQGLELLLNKMTRDGIAIWKVKRFKSGAMLFYIPLRDIHKLRKAARRFECRISFVRGEGAPFLWKRLFKNSGFLVGMLSFIILITVLSNITWGIEIKGANPETEHKIRKELTKIGVQIGTSHFLNQDLEKIQRELTERVDNITWIGVELKGTTFHFQVVEKTEPKKQETRSPSHLVATKKAVIEKMFVEKGKPLVKVNQFVEKGQILVSGTIGNDEETKTIPARGEVWGKTWYQTHAEFPLQSTFQVFSGEEKRTHALKFGSFSVPVWGFGKTGFKNYEVETEVHPVRFLGWQLPLAYVEKTARATEEYERSLTKKEAREAGRELARRDLAKNIPEDARIDDEIILHEEVENGKVKLTIYFQVIENIAKEKPVTQGD